jgi:integrase
MHGAPIPPWRIHDLRRSFATHAAEMGIQPHIIEAVLNHVSGSKAGVAGIYNRATHEPEKRAALVRWADLLTAWIEKRESNVAALKRA